MKRNVTIPLFSGLLPKKPGITANSSPSLLLPPAKVAEPSSSSTSSKNHHSWHLPHSSWSSSNCLSNSVLHSSLFAPEPTSSVLIRSLMTLITGRNRTLLHMLPGAILVPPRPGCLLLLSPLPPYLYTQLYVGTYLGTSCWRLLRSKSLGLTD